MSLCINPSCPKPANHDHLLFCQACGSELLLAGRYRVTRLLSGKGGFGRTYDVSENGTAKVLKVLINNHPKAVELFQKEARVLSQLNHPGIPKGEGDFIFFARNSQMPLYCLVMQRIEGMDLEDYQRHRQNRPIDPRLALSWLSQLGKILHEVHNENFFHRDIKPSNIILKPDGQLTLIDFGAVREVTATIRAGGQNTQVYTPGYAAPEQEKGYAVPQSDFFALGRTFVFLLTGKLPTHPDMYAPLKDELVWRSHVSSNILPELLDFIDKLMMRSANQRPANTTVILESLAELDQILNPPLPPPKPKKPIVGVSAPPPSKLGRRKIIQLAGLDRYRGGFNCDRTSFGKMWLWIRVYRRAHFLTLQV